MSGEKRTGTNQFVLVDQIFEHDQENLAHIFVFAGGRAALPKTIPANWTFPTNFYQGKIYIRVKVLSKPTNAKVRYMLYLMSGGHGDQYRAVIGHNLVEFSEPGIYIFEQAVLDIFDYQNIHWERSLEEMLVSVWDKNNFPVDTRHGHAGKWEGSPDLSIYYPMKVHYTAVVVAKDNKFQGFPSSLDFFLTRLQRVINQWKSGLRDTLKSLLSRSST